MLESVIRDWAKDNKNLLIIYTINILFGVIAGYYLVPSISSKVIDSISKTGTIEMILMISLFSAYIFISCADLLKRWLEDSFVPDFNMNVRNEIFRYVISSYNKGKDIEIGKLLNVMSYLPSSIRNIMLDVLRIFLPLTIAIVVMIVYFFNLNHNVAYVQIGTLAILSLNLYFYAKRLIKEADDSMDDYLKISEKSKDRISNLGSIFTSNQEKFEVNRYKNINRKNIEIYRSSLRGNWKLNSRNEILILTSFAVFNYVLFQQDIPKEIKTSIFVAEIYYFLKIFSEFQKEIVGLFVNLGESKALLRYLDEIVESLRDDVNVKKRIKNDRLPAISFKNIDFGYDEDKLILENFNMEIFKGERVFLKGASGSGKSTIFQLLLDGIKATDGDIEIFGRDNTEMRGHVFLVDQRTNLFNESVLKNIRYGNDFIEESEIEDLIEKLGVNIFEKLPDGLQSKVGIDGSKVSGGQRQLIILLRAYFSDAKIILLDEPIAAIDTENVPLIIKMIDEIGKNRTIIAISHNDEIESVLNRVITL
jgi:ABC-type bacteriocin/lantibiotic exporter with double-glycine peptidase domain